MTAPVDRHGRAAVRRANDRLWEDVLERNLLAETPDLGWEAG